MEEKSAESTSPAISLPQGGGSIQGIGETFQPNLFSGTGNFNIPIFTSPGREGFHPQLSLQYSTGNGNGIFGLGWDLSIPRITRKTEKGLPRYNNDDVFVMSGAEDLVPKLESNNPPNTVPGGTQYQVTRYLPRTEGLFARIESWQKLDQNNNNSVIDHFWRVTTKENITSIYGRTGQARITHPDNKHKIYQWLLEETFDSKGNHIYYEYAKDDQQQNIDVLFEQNRTYCQVYPRRIFYGNVADQLTDYDGTSFTAGVKRSGTDHRDLFNTLDRHYLFEVVFDYGDWQHPQFVYKASPTGQEKFDSSIPVRPDPFSSFRPGFELRTLRRCTNILMIHHFRELNGATLVKSTDFEYNESNDSNISFLSSATVTGYSKSGNVNYDYESMPPVEFRYSDFQPAQQKYQTITAKNQYMPPVSLNDPNTALVDLFGNGLQDIVQTGPTGFQYWRNLGDAKLDHPHVLHESPSGLTLADTGVSFADMGGDGLTDLMVSNSPVQGFFELKAETEVDGQLQGGWSPDSFKHYDDQPSINLSGPNLRMLDLTGDGLTDLLITTDHEFIWHQSVGEQGYSDPIHVAKEHGLEDIYFNDLQGRVRLADMTGDGLKDIVLLHNGRVDYWPNMGYGKFGPMITMSDIDGDTHLPPGFNPKRLFLADLDGSGTADLVYVDFNEVHFWFNQSGNSWSKKQIITGTPVTVDTASLSFTDFYGTGTTCLLWSYDHGTFQDGNYKVLDFCGGTKPYLLTEMDNNLGTTTRVRYASSTKFYLDDVAQKRFWATPLPFPVQVVEKTESIDHISKTKLVTCYKYHHGFYDGQEREFRGFGRVDQIDTEFFDIFGQHDLHENEFDNINEAHHLPPVETRTWFHTGAYFEHANILDKYKSEYFSGIAVLDANQQPRDSEAFDLGNHDIQLEPGDPVTEAHRALRGSILRTEVYAHDTSTERNFPYLVTENTFRVKFVQGKHDNPHAVYLTTPKDAISYHYERKHNGRNLVDPRIQHQLTWDIDDFGNPQKSAGIAYKRRQTNHPEQDKDLISITTNSYCDLETNSTDFRHSTSVETTQYELTGLNRTLNSSYKITELDTALSNASSLGFEQQPTTGQLQKRKLNQQINLFWENDLSGSRPIGKIGHHGLLYESYQLALTASMRSKIFGDGTLTTAMAAEGGYRSKSSDNWGNANQGHWWIPSGKQTFDSGKFFQPIESIDPFANKTTIQYDPYSLYPVQIQDPLNNLQQGLIDYRVLQPYLIKDINGNHTEAAFNSLGLPVATAVMGKAGRNPSVSLLDISTQQMNQMRTNSEADSLQGFDPTVVDTNNPLNSLKRATNRIIYDFHNYTNHSEPIFACTIAREKHNNESSPPPLQISYTYSDGFGREIQKKIQAEPENNQNNTQAKRWVGSGWTIFNNKGKPVQQYEPFFTDTHNYQSYQELKQQNKLGVSSTLFYDPLQRVICTLHPKHDYTNSNQNYSYEKVLFNPWQQVAWDSNDTVLLDPSTDPDVKDYVAKFIAGINNFSTWYQYRIPDPANTPGQPNREQQAALKAAEHAATPTTSHLNVLGTVFLTIANNKTETLETRQEVDIQGNDLSITDPRGIKAFKHQFDMIGRKLRINSQDAGDRRLFLSVDNQPLSHWDANGNQVNNDYDALRRPQNILVKKPGGATHLIEHLIYGESRAQAESSNSKGTVWKHYDGAGLAITEHTDFKGNVLKSQRKLLTNNTATEISWPLDANGQFDETAAVSLLETTTRLNTSSYEINTEFDALNRVTSNRLPDGTLHVPGYNEANLLETVTVQHPNQNAETYIKNIDYNAKGQRVKIEYGNGIVTDYDYEPETFRLKSITSKRTNPNPKTIQELSYVYDPVGNISSIRDDAHKRIFNHSQTIEPQCNYTYDTVYRLIEASGREHEAMTACHYQTNGKKHTEFLPLPQSTANAQALINYLEKYQYDKSGNIERIEHSNSLRTTIRNQTYDSQSNRIDKSIAGCSNENSSIPHDANGNITQLPHLPSLDWDYKNQLVEVQLNQGTNPNKAYYQYDSGGQRVRKTIVKNNGNDIAERIYLGGYEIYTETVANTLQKQRDSTHVMDDKERIAIIELEKDTNNPTQVISKATRFQLNNHLGSSSLELDESAQTISYEEYYPYGGSAYMAGRNQTEASLKRYRYSGKERDDETGMYYYGARYYAPWMGRWLSCDPLRAVNYFKFNNNNPIAFVDPDGRAPACAGHWGCELSKEDRQMIDDWLQEDVASGEIALLFGENGQDDMDSRRELYENMVSELNYAESYAGKADKIIEDAKSWASSKWSGAEKTAVETDASVREAATGFFQPLSMLGESADPRNRGLEPYPGALTPEDIPKIAADVSVNEAYGIATGHAMGGVMGVVVRRGKLDDEVRAMVRSSGMGKGLAPRLPRTYLWAIQHRNGAATFIKRVEGKLVKVKYDKHGFPDFSKHLYKGPGKNTVEIRLTGNRDRDFAAANKAAGLPETPEGYTWHHDLSTDLEHATMQLVKTDVHNTFPHQGSFSIHKNIFYY